MTARFVGKTAIVTGAASGIGRATAERLSAEGARLVVTDRTPDALEDLIASIGERHVSVCGDISEQAVVNEVVTAAGPVDILINNAGIMDGFLPVDELDDQTWERVIAVNLTAPMRLMRATIPNMVAAGGGSIVNVASEAGLRGASAGAAYTASKAALIGLTKNTAFMYAPDGLRVNAIAPGPVATNIDAPFTSQRALNRLGPLFGVIVPPIATPAQIAAAICYLASPDAENITGAVLTSDGGWSAI